MFPRWRLKLREAKLAYQGGRYSEAGRLLQEGDLREFLPAKRLAEELTDKMCQRAQQRMLVGETDAGWQDLDMVDRLGGSREEAGRLRGEFRTQALAEVRRYLASGESQAALAQLARLERRGIAGPEERLCQQVATLMSDARAAAMAGRFAEAASALARAGHLSKQGSAGSIDNNSVERNSANNNSAKMDTIEVRHRLQRASEELTRQAIEFEQLAGQLHACLARQDWSQVLAAAEAMLRLAPAHKAARRARRRAWQAVGLDATRGRALPCAAPVSLKYGRGADPVRDRSTRSSIRSCEEDTVTGREDPKRLLIWVDAVGGYLVCLDDQIVLGQPTPGHAIALPIMADLSRRHAVIRRDGGNYIIEPVHRTLVDGRELTGPTLLADNQLIQLGESVRLRFRKPHALSSTARLTLESHHHTQPRADGVLLMADSAILGSKSHCHIRCRDWQEDVILFRQGDTLKCRASGPLTVDGEAYAGPIAVTPGARIEGDDFSLCMEEVASGG